MTLHGFPAAISPRGRFARFGLALAALIAASAIGVGGAANGHRAHLSDDLARHEARGSKERARVIVHGTKAEIDALVLRHGLAVVRSLRNGAVLRATSREISILAADPALDHLSGDPLVTVSMSVSNKSTAADQTRAGTSGLLFGIGGLPGVTGQGVGVAVVDSGIAPHAALKGKIVANVSFVTGDPSTSDEYGHGTHVAGIIAGSASSSITSLYTGGIAPGVRLVNVRVIGNNGSGYTSDVIDGIDWVIENRALYNIRVINLSLGHPVMESSATDPLCEAVARAVAAGIVVVAAAGNDGRTNLGVPIIGGITSPGNSSYAITVGALNTWGTVRRDDDTVAPYSSRGPTKFDFAVKPDVAAPGNKIVSLEAAGSYLSYSYPALHLAGSGSNTYMQLSGTSMAAPMVSGGIALLLQANPGLGTAHVKLALQSGATYVPDGGLMGAGAGSVNFFASRQIASKGLSVLTSGLINTLVGGLLTPPSGASFWDAGTMSDRVYRGVGVRLLSILDLSSIWSDPSLLKWGDLNLVGLLNPLRLVRANPLIWGNEVMSWRNGQNQIISATDDQIVWGTTMYDADGDQIVWGTSGDDQIVWGTGTLTNPDPQ